MAVHNLYSKRRKAELRAGQSDVFQYEKVPQKLRAQLVHVWREAIGTTKMYKYEPEGWWQYIHDVMAREQGVLALGKVQWGFREACETWFLTSASDEEALDLIELVARVIERCFGGFSEHDRYMRGLDVSAASALEEINQRFRENDVGFQHENGSLIRLDSQYIHANVVKPALALLSAEPFGKANEDFIGAHKHYRDGKHKDCVVACQRAFESVLKAICTKHGWSFGAGDRASELISVVRKNGLFPDYLSKSFDTYIAMLKSGLPDVRNNAGGHGEAPNAQPVPSYIAAYALHLSAANIVMAVGASNGLKGRPD